MSDHDRLGEWSAAYVLGSLDTRDRATFERHLDTCERCRSDVASFAPIPGLLAKVDTAPSEPVPATVLANASERISNERQVLVASRRRWRWTAVAALAAVIVAVSSGLGGPTVTTVALEPEWGVTGEVTVSARYLGNRGRVRSATAATRCDMYRLGGRCRRGVATGGVVGSHTDTPGSRHRIVLASAGERSRHHRDDHRPCRDRHACHSVGILVTATGRTAIEPTAACITLAERVPQARMCSMLASGDART